MNKKKLQKSLGKQREKAAKLKIPKIQRHIFLCVPTKAKCAKKKTTRAAWSYLCKRLKQLGLRGAGGIYPNKVDCLDICHAGPIAVVYPEGAWYGNCEPVVLEEIIEEHLIGGRIVEKYLIEQHDMPCGIKLKSK